MCLQVPAPSQVSLVQVSPSSGHVAPAMALMWMQPLFGSQLSLVHGLLSSQVCTPPPTQLPAAHASLWVQALPSSQARPAC